MADGLSRISSKELEKVISDTAHMVNEMKPDAIKHFWDLFL